MNLEDNDAEKAATLKTKNIYQIFGHLTLTKKTKTKTGLINHHF